MINDRFNRAMNIMRRLRAPGGCPWDAEQSHDSLKRYLIEECYEVIEAIDKGDDGHLKEELGDLLLQPIFHAAIAEERGAFTMNDVLETLADKLVRRHPHVFGDQEIRTSDEQVANWEKIKKEEKGEERKSALAGVPPHLPALMKAQKITERLPGSALTGSMSTRCLPRCWRNCTNWKRPWWIVIRNGWRRNWGTCSLPLLIWGDSSP